MTVRRFPTLLGALFLASACSRTERAPDPKGEGKPMVAPKEVTLGLPSTPRGEELLARARAAFLTRVEGVERPVLGSAQIGAVTTDGRVVHTRPVGLRAFAVPVATVEVTLPELADAPMVVRSTASDLAVRVRPVGFAQRPAEWAEQIAVYPGVSAGVDAFRVVQATGVEDFYQVEAARDELAFEQEITLEHVAGLRLVADTLELLDATGNPLVRATPPIAFDSTGRARAGHLRVVGCRYDEDPRGPWGRPVVAAGQDTCRLIATVDGRGLSFPVLFDPTWQGTGTTKQTHAYHQLHALQGGVDKDKVLLVNGTGSFPGVTELFNPKSTPLTWASSSSYPGIVTMGQGSGSVALKNGTVVAFGGAPTSGTTACQATVVVRSPTTGVWGPGAAMSSPRCYAAAATADVDGKESVLVFGGQAGSGAASSFPPIKTAQIYDSATDTWSPLAAGLSVPRARARAVRLNDGRVLIAGGEDYSTATFTTTPWETAEIWNPTTKAFVAAPSMAAKRSGGELVALPGTKPYAVFAGGTATSSVTGALDSLEVFDGTKWTLLTAKLGSARYQFASSLLDDGRVLFTGGYSYSPLTGAVVTDAADLFVPGADPTAATLVGATIMADRRQWHAMVNVPGLGALVTGGLTTTATLGSETNSSEVFNVAIGGACGTGCTGGLSCVDGVCCSTSTCPSGQKCNNPGREGVCTKPKGDTCTTSSECATGYCVTGVCCESSCTGGCNTCSEAGSLGTCKPAPTGTDPAKFCGTDPYCSKKCDGTGKCQVSYPGTSTSCGASATDAGTGPFCAAYACNGFGSCTSKTNDCGLTCTTTVSCDETTKTCTPIATGIKAGYCVIDSKCWAYGDVNPKDSCQVCDPPTSKLTWSASTEASCTDGGVDSGIDTGALDTGLVDSAVDTGVVDSGTSADTGPLDTGIEDGGLEDTGPATGDLPEAGGCSVGAAPTAFAELGVSGMGAFLAALALRRRRAR